MSTVVDIQDFYAGCGGATSGLKRAGAKSNAHQVEVRYAVNHWDVAVDTHSRNHPDTEHVLTDLSTSSPKRYRRTRVAWFSPECFPAGTLILTQDGLLPIENVVVGDWVLTHRGRWRPVTSTMSSVRDTVVVRGSGHWGLETTGEHPFYTRHRTFAWDNDKRDYAYQFAEPEWQVANQLGLKAPARMKSRSEAMLWAMPTVVPELVIPQSEGRRGLDFTPEFWWFVGRWLGDGSVRIREGHAQITVCCGFHEGDEVEQRLGFARPRGERASQGELHWTRRDVRTATLFEAEHIGLGNWLVAHFGKLAHGKTVPAWALTMPKEWRIALLEGYASADGHQARRNLYTATTVSRGIAVGIKLLAQSLGYSVVIGKYAQHSLQIEGRKVNGRDVYVVRWRDAERVTTYKDELHEWAPVRAVEPGSPGVVVYNLSVADDESYVADGVVVHNCTTHSPAGGRKRKNQGQLNLFEASEYDPSVERSRATAWTVVDFTEYHRYDLVFVENVVEFREWEMYKTWYNAMLSLGYHGHTVYMNSMHAHPTPQSRDRMYIIFWNKKITKKPNFKVTPRAHCAQCGKDVNSVQSWKNPNIKWGKYGKRNQYLFRCPKCANVVEPHFHPASEIIDWSVPMRSVGDRKGTSKELVENTRKRIRAGLKRFWGQGLVIDSANGGKVRSWDEPTFTQTTAQTQAAAVPPFVVPLRANNNPVGLDEPVPTGDPGNHLYLARPFLASYYGGRDALAGLDEVVPTITTAPRHALVAAPFIQTVAGSSDYPTLDGIDQPVVHHHRLGRAPGARNAAVLHDLLRGFGRARDRRGARYRHDQG